MTTRHIYQGTDNEPLTITVRSNVLLDAQTIEVSFDGDTWLPATWQGAPGFVRKATATLTPANTPPANDRLIPVYGRIDGDVIFRADGDAVVHPV